MLVKVENELVQDLRSLIEESRNTVATVVNSTLTMLYWNIGRRINAEVLKGERAEYGKQIVASLARQLADEYGKGWSERNLAYMIRLYESFPDIHILHTLCAKLSWSHFKLIIYMEDPLKLDFYAEMCRLERWSVRTLRSRIDSMLYERTAISQKPDELIQQELTQLRESNQLTPDLVFKDPYFLDFLGIKDHYYEKDLEDAILRELEQFILELGAGFTFIARQKRIQIDNEDFYIDLLFYNRKLKRLIAIDLKLGSFKAAYKGQMELYLRWLAKYETEDGEQPPLGIILCAGKQQEQIELLELDQSGIHVAEYLTVLPPLEVLQQKLHSAIENSRNRLDNREEGNGGQKDV